MVAIRSCPARTPIIFVMLGRARGLDHVYAAAATWFDTLFDSSLPGHVQVWWNIRCQGSCCYLISCNFLFFGEIIGCGAFVFILIQFILSLIFRPRSRTNMQGNVFVSWNFPTNVKPLSTRRLIAFTSN